MRWNRGVGKSVQRRRMRGMIMGRGLLGGGSRGCSRRCILRWIRVCRGRVGRKTPKFLLLSMDYLPTIKYKTQENGRANQWLPTLKNCQRKTLRLKSNLNSNGLASAVDRAEALSSKQMRPFNASTRTPSLRLTRQAEFRIFSTHRRYIILRRWIRMLKFNYRNRKSEPPGATTPWNKDNKWWVWAMSHSQTK